MIRGDKEQTARGKNMKCEAQWLNDGRGTQAAIANLPFFNKINVNNDY